jgi:hypothetical protein
MKDIAIAIEIGSPQSTVNLVKTTFISIEKNIGQCEWKVFICLGLHISRTVREFVIDWIKNHSDNFEIFLEDEVSWAFFINKAIEISNEYKYFVKSHDDIELQTSNFYEKVNKTIEGLGKLIGWVSFTDTGWQRGDFSPAVRPGYYLDHYSTDNWQKGVLFQFHNFPPHWYRNNILIDKVYLFISKIGRILGFKHIPYPKPIKKIRSYSLDLPKQIVKCHAPFNHFVLIQRASLDLIGKCEDWNTPNALYVDEDWGLRALKLNLPNVWIPEISYFHYRGKVRRGGTRSNEVINFHKKRVEILFKEKWGFNTKPTKEELNNLQQEYKDTLIPWSSYRNSFDWDYSI